MSCWLLPIRRSDFRPYLRLPCRGTAVASAQALFRCRPRCSSTFSPSSIAELLRPSSAQAFPLQPGPSDRESLQINGYIRSVRKQKRIAFAAIGDGSTLQTIQAVLPPQLAEGLSTGAAVTVTGKWTASQGQGQAYELQVENVNVLGENDAAKYQSPEYLRTIPHLRPRLPVNALILRLRSLVTAQVTSYFAQQDFVQCHPPIITSSDCEGAGEVFTVAPEAHSTQISGTTSQITEQEDLFFGSPKYLTVSSQLHLEALAQSVNKVWTLSPTFRAEKSDTARHLSEFYMLEAELAFVTDLKDVMDVVENLLRAVATALQSSVVGQELLEARARDQGADATSVSQSVLAQRWRRLIEGPWPRITYDAAIQHLKDAVAQGHAVFEYAPGHDDGLQTEHERYLAESVGRGGPVFVTDYPRNIKPFYMAPSNASETESQATSTVACFDLLVPEICELVGGSMREHRLNELLKSMKDHGLSVASDTASDAADGSLQWYADLRRYGSVPHGGFGLGFDRLLCYLSGVSNIRDDFTLLSRSVDISANMSAMASEVRREGDYRGGDDQIRLRSYGFPLTPERYFSGPSNTARNVASSDSRPRARHQLALQSITFTLARAAVIVLLLRASGSGIAAYSKGAQKHCLGSGLVLFMTATRRSVESHFPMRAYNLDNSNLRHCRLSTNTIAATLRAPIPYPLKLKTASAATLESAAPVTTGRLMATHDRPAVALEEEHDYEALPPNFSLTANMLAGAFAGIAEHSVMYPVDLLKTRIQILNPSPGAMYSGISNAMVTISRVEGFRTLWKGLSRPAHAVYFASYEATKHALGGNEGGHEEHHPLAAAASGAAATISSDALMNPFDVIKQRMQMHGSIYKSVPQCAREVFRTEGLGAFYVSYPTTLCMTVPFTALQFMAYESLSKVMNPTGRYDPYTHCFAGGIAGGIAAGFTTPLDVIKTLLQTRGNATDTELRNVSGLWQAAKIIKQREGFKGYFRGLKPRIITTMPSTAICWSAYEMAKAFFIRRSTDPSTSI
ncbi:hypothetical protein FB567DRAFT_430836 [Paraphoma chrysanthemicola]|uniref:asparagine--tRNA ligase n=1 Tax=Paraphoma chrysanthemicola TaxID=798071 RepID=A0A8K0RHZ1_9PLEO|nr:hypothetical protein FB567DRAFT_430836 [Paraphoma chrysanthemicola]